MPGNTPQRWPHGANFYLAPRGQAYPRTFHALGLPPLALGYAPGTGAQVGPGAPASFANDWTAAGQTPPRQSLTDVGVCNPCREAGADRLRRSDITSVPRSRPVAELTGTPTQAAPYIAAGDTPPQPGGTAASRLSFDSEAEADYYAAWWYRNYTADGPAIVTAPPPPPPPPPPPIPPPPPPLPPPPRPPPEPVATHVPTVEELEGPPVAEPVIVETVGEEVPPVTGFYVEPPTVTPATVTAEPVASKPAKPVPWGWIVGGSLAAIGLVGGGVYLVTRPKRRRG